MSLIDPTTPEGFFHLRLGPYKMRLLESGEAFYPEAPNPDQETYFEEPQAGAGKDGIQVDPALLTAKGLLEELRLQWAAQGETLLVEMTEPLEGLRRHIVMNRRPEDEDPEISDFVYPLF